MELIYYCVDYSAVKMKTPSWIFSALLCSVIALPMCTGFFREEPRLIELKGIVGSFVVFNCKIQFPLESPMPYILHWFKEVSDWMRGLFLAKMCSK